MSLENVDYIRDGYTVLSLVEEMERLQRKRSATAKEVAEYRPLPGLDEATIEHLMGFLKNQGFLTGNNMYGGRAYILTDKGRQMVWHAKGDGKAELTFPDPNRLGHSISIGSSSTAPFQAAVNTGSGTIHATQHNHPGAEQQTQILALLGRLEETLAAMPATPDRDTAQVVLQTARDAAQEGAWDLFAGRMNGLMTFLVMLSTLAADGPAALEIGRDVIRVLGGGA